MAAVLNYRLRLGAAALLASTSLVTAVGLALPVSLPQAYSSPIALAPVSEARALAAANQTPPRLIDAEALTRATLAQRPGDAAAWARLAWIAGERARPEEMLEALDRSYAVAPFGPEISAWRLRFAYGRWSSLTPELRRLAAAELAVTVRTRPRVANLALAGIEDPAGRLAYIMGQRLAQQAQRREQEQEPARIGTS